MKKYKKTNIEDVKKIIEKKNGVFIEELWKPWRVKIQCNRDGTVWSPKPRQIIKGQWCPECFKDRHIKKVDKKTVIKFVSEKGFELLTTDNIDFWSPIKLRCPKHDIEWETKYGTLVRGNSNCKFCGHDAIKAEDLNQALKELNATLVKRLKTCQSNRNLLLHCNIHNHDWKSNAAAIVIHDRICYYCARENRKTPYIKIKAMVESKGGALLTENCVGSLTKIQVRCAEGHEWETYYDNINQGYWCPSCKYKTQRKLFDIVQSIFPVYKMDFNYHGFDWLRYKNKLEIDIWISEIKLAIEYDGEQHYRPVKFGSHTTDKQAADNFASLQLRDQKKNELIQQHTDDVKYFVRVPFDYEITKDSIIKLLSDFKVPI